MSEECRKHQTDKIPSPIRELRHNTDGRVEIKSKAGTLGEALKIVDI